MANTEALGTRFDPKQYRSKETALNGKLLKLTSGKSHQLLEEILEDSDLLAYQKYANTVAVRRLHYNDHGPVHMRITALHALKILRYLSVAGIETSLETEGLGTLEDSEVAILFGSLLHDLGMGVTRVHHEWHSINLGDEFLAHYLPKLYPEDRAIRCIIRTMVHEIIVGHMATESIHSVEAGVMLVADGTDMTQGRARIVGTLLQNPAVGDMHKHSADAVQRVQITEGTSKPVMITIEMSDYAGIFQVEEVLLPKVEASPIKNYLQIKVEIQGQEPRFYLQ